jgi:hypothetical protein
MTVTNPKYLDELLYGIKDRREFKHFTLNLSKELKDVRKPFNPLYSMRKLKQMIYQ